MAKRFLLLLFVLLVSLLNLSAYTISINTDSSFILDTGKAEYIIDDSVWTKRFDGISIDQYGDEIFLVDDGSNSILVSLSDDAEDLENVLFQMSYISASKRPKTLVSTAIDEKIANVIIRSKLNFTKILMPSFLPSISAYAYKNNCQLIVLPRNAIITATMNGGVSLYDLDSWKNEVGGKQIIVVCPRCGEQISVYI